MQNCPTDYSAHTLLEEYYKKKLSPVEVVQAILKKIANHNSSLNAYRFVDNEYAMSSAREAESRWFKGEPIGILDGVPVSVKDVFATKNWSTRWGSLLTSENHRANEDAPPVARLREEGAILLGKTNTSEFHWKTVTDSPLTGITRNPWNLDLTPGGSCGGTAVAVAAGMGPIGLGTDGGGSIRIPAAFSGVFGLKPTFGLVPQFPVGAFGTMAHTGPISKSVEDAATMLTVISKPDFRDWYALPFLNIDYQKGLKESMAGVKIGFSPNFGFVEVEKPVTESVKKAVEIFEMLGAKIDEINPGFQDLREVFETLGFPGIAQSVAKFSVDERRQLDKGLLKVSEIGETISLSEYLAANSAREAAGQIMQKFHKKYDLLLTPTVPISPFPVGQDVPHPEKQVRWTEWVPFSYPFNLTRQPAASVPCGLNENGLPVGLQIIGPLFGDQDVLSAAYAFEKAQPFLFPKL